MLKDCMAYPMYAMHTDILFKSVKTIITSHIPNCLMLKFSHSYKFTASPNILKNDLFMEVDPKCYL